MPVWNSNASLLTEAAFEHHRRPDAKPDERTRDQQTPPEPRVVFLEKKTGHPGGNTTEKDGRGTHNAN